MVKNPHTLSTKFESSEYGLECRENSTDERRSEVKKPATSCKVAGLAETPDGILSSTDRSGTCPRPPVRAAKPNGYICQQMAQLHLSKKFYPHRQAQANDTWDEPIRIEPAPAIVRSKGRAFRPARRTSSLQSRGCMRDRLLSTHSGHRRARTHRRNAAAQHSSRDLQGMLAWPTCATRVTPGIERHELDVSGDSPLRAGVERRPRRRRLR